MRMFVISLAFLASLGPAAAEDSPAHAFCRMTSASEPTAMAACVNAQIAGAQSVVRWLDWAKKTADPAALHIISTFESCRARWSPDYALIDACLRIGSPIAPPQG